MAGTAPEIYDVNGFEPAPGGKDVHHGRTVAAWLGSMITLVAFLVGAAGVLLRDWTVFWAGAVLVVIALILTVVLQKMGKGAV